MKPFTRAVTKHRLLRLCLCFSLKWMNVLRIYWQKWTWNQNNEQQTHHEGLGEFLSTYRRTWVHSPPPPSRHGNPLPVGLTRPRSVGHIEALNPASSSNTKRSRAAWPDQRHQKHGAVRTNQPLNSAGFHHVAIGNEMRAGFSSVFLYTSTVSEPS